MKNSSPAQSQTFRNNQARLKTGDNPLSQQKPDVFIRSGSQDLVSLRYIKALVKQCATDYVAKVGFVHNSPCAISFIHDGGFLSLLSAQIKTLKNPSLSMRTEGFALQDQIRPASIEGFHEAFAAIVVYEKLGYAQGLAFYWALADKVKKYIEQIGLTVELKSLAVQALNAREWKNRLNVDGDCQAVAAMVLKEQDKTNNWSKTNER